MSTFLSKLAGQDLGPSEAIRPRVPSIYEPYRRVRAPGWAESGARGAGVAAGDEFRAETSADDESMRVAEPRSEVVRGRDPLSWRSEISDELQHADETERGPHSTRPAPVSFERERSGLRAAESRPLSAVVQRTEIAKVELGQQGGRASGTSGAFLRRLSSEAISPSSPTAGSRLISASVSSEPRVAPGAGANHIVMRRSATKESAASASGAGAIRAGELSNDAARQRSRRAESANAKVGSRGDSLLPDLSLADSVLSDSVSDSFLPSLIKPMTIATRAIPGAMAVQSSEPIDLAIARGPANRAPDSESALRVTIGRVEVRAVFPPPTPRRAQAAKPRPTLSLDDYLQRDLKRNINRDPGQR